MSWLAITEAKLLEKISGDELSAIRDAALAEAQPDPVAEAITRVTKEVRGYVSSPKAQNRLHEDATFIPDELMDAALAQIVMRFVSRPGGLVMDPKGERKRQAEEGKELLELVAAGGFGIVQPTEVTTEEVGAPSPSFGSRNRKFTDCTQDGI